MSDPDALRLEVREFLRVERDGGRFERRCDAWLQGHDPDFSRKLGAKGWLGMTWPTEYGGQGRSNMERFAVAEELLAAGAPVSAHWTTDRQTGPLFLKYGTEDQRRRFLPAMARGELFFVIGMSEPDSGSDLASIRTRAERVPGGWKVHGQKVWTSNAQHSHYMVALVRTSPRGDDRHAGLSQLVIDLSADAVEVRPIRLMTGETHFAEVVFDGAFVPDADLVGTEGNGWKQVLAELTHERSGPERYLSTLPLLIALVEMLKVGADTRRAATIGALLARLWSLRCLSLHVSQLLEAGEDPGTQAAIVKDVGTRLEREIALAARSIIPHQPWQTTEYHRLLAQGLLSAPGFTLRGGTNEILRGIIARALGVR